MDGSGNAYVTGYTDSTNFPTANAFQSALRRRVGRLRDEVERGRLGPGLFHLPRRQRLEDDTGNPRVGGIAVDASGNAYVTGITYFDQLPHHAGAFQTTYGGGDPMPSWRS